MSASDLLSIIDKGGTIGLLATMIIALVRRWVVPAYVVDDLQKQLAQMRDDRDEWRRAALWGTDVAKKLSDTVPLLKPSRSRGGP